MARSKSRHPLPDITDKDELAKLAKLKEQGVITGAQFQQMKQELLKKL